MNTRLTFLFKLGLGLLAITSASLALTGGGIMALWIILLAASVFIVFRITHGSPLKLGIAIGFLLVFLFLLHYFSQPMIPIGDPTPQKATTFMGYKLLAKYEKESQLFEGKQEATLQLRSDLFETVNPLVDSLLGLADEEISDAILSQPELEFPANVKKGWQLDSTYVREGKRWFVISQGKLLSSSKKMSLLAFLTEINIPKWVFASKVCTPSYVIQLPRSMKMVHNLKGEWQHVLDEKGKIKHLFISKAFQNPFDQQIRVKHLSNVFHIPVLNNLVYLAGVNTYWIVFVIVLLVMGYIMGVGAGFIKHQAFRPIARRILQSLRLLGELPVVFLAFANDRSNQRKYLRNLPLELRSIRQSLAPLEDQDKIELVEKANVTIEEIYDTFQRKAFKGKINIFHFGGHADDEFLLTESDQGSPVRAFSKGLMAFLSKQEGLRFVFLNACLTSDQAQQLSQGGIPFVLGTSNYVNDEVAQMFASQFYKTLAKGFGVLAAFEETVDFIQTKKGGDHRGLFWEGMEEEIQEKEMPWFLFSNNSLNDWKIT